MKRAALMLLTAGGLLCATMSTIGLSYVPLPGPEMIYFCKVYAHWRVLAHDYEPGLDARCAGYITNLGRPV